MIGFATVNFVASGHENAVTDFAHKVLTDHSGKFELDFEKITPKPAVLRGLDRGAFWPQFSAHEIEVALEALVRKPIPGKFGVGPKVDSLLGNTAKKLMLKTYNDLEQWVSKQSPWALERAAKCQVAHAETGYYFEEDWESDCWGGDAKRMVFSMAKLSSKQYRARFSFPWNAPRPIFHAIARDYPSLNIRADAHEPQYGYHYAMNAAKGTVSEDWPKPNDA